VEGEKPSWRYGAWGLVDPGDSLGDLAGRAGCLHRVHSDIGEQPIVFCRHGLGVGHRSGCSRSRLTGEQIEDKAQHGAPVLRLSAIRGDAIRGRCHDKSTRAQGTYVLLVQVLRPSGRRGHDLQRGTLAAANCQNRPTMAPVPP
jgi:hypothetical protein